MLSFLVLSTTAFAQECPTGCLPEAFCTLPTDSCALQAVPSDDQDAVSWIDNAFGWHRNRPTWALDQVSDLDPTSYLLDPTQAASTSTSAEQACAIDHLSGAIHCYGNSNANGQISGRPTGSEPYTSLAVGNVAALNSTNQAWAALNGSGVVTLWGYGGTGTFVSGKPTASGFDGVAVGFGPVGCAVDSAVAGVSCWGSDTQLIVSNRPTTGNYKAVGIGRYNAGAVSTTGSLTLWGASATAYVNFRNTWTGATDVSEVFFTEVGEVIGLAYHTDGTITIWQNPNSTGGQLRVIKNVPCATGVNCPTGAARAYRTVVQFRSAPRLTKSDAPASICGVVRYDPNGTYACGDVICWGHYAENTDDPQLVQECADPTYCQ